MISEVEEEVEVSKGEVILGAETNLKGLKESPAIVRKVGILVAGEAIEEGGLMEEGDSVE